MFVAFTPLPQKRRQKPNAVESIEESTVETKQRNFKEVVMSAQFENQLTESSSDSPKPIVRLWFWAAKQSEKLCPDNPKDKIIDSTEERKKSERECGDG